MKRKMILAVVVLSLVAGCGTKEQKTAENRKETTAKVTENQTAESQEQELKENETVINGSETGAIETVLPGTTTENSTLQEETSGNVTDNSTDSADRNSSAGNNSNHNSSTSAGNHNNTSSANAGNTSASGNSANSSNNPTTGNSSPAPVQPTHTHTWVHVDGTGHYETVTLQAAYDEEVPVYENVPYSICNQCGADVTGDIDAHYKANLETCWAYHTEWRYEQTGTQIIHHDAVTEQRYVQDTPEYDMCSGCGATKDCSCPVIHIPNIPNL